MLVHDGDVDEPDFAIELAGVTELLDADAFIL